MNDKRKNCVLIDSHIGRSPQNSWKVLVVATTRLLVNQLTFQKNLKKGIFNIIKAHNNFCRLTEEASLSEFQMSAQ